MLLLQGNAAKGIFWLEQSWTIMQNCWQVVRTVALASRKSALKVIATRYAASTIPVVERSG